MHNTIYQNLKDSLRITSGIHICIHTLHVEGELQRQVALLEHDKSEDIPDTEKLYDVLEVSTNDVNPPDASYTSLSRVVENLKI